jgi:hypothetical protein
VEPTQLEPALQLENAGKLRTEATVLNAYGKNKYLGKCPDAEVRAVLSFSHPTIPNLKHVRI